MRLCILGAMLIYISVLSSVTLTVRQDGLGQFTTIQSAIIASSNNDIVLVHPGRYFENIDYLGKSITVASLELTTGNPAYRDSTIIDGNDNGSCVSVHSNEVNAGIYGFTIQHGSGYSYISTGAIVSQGGGLRIRNAQNFSITNCLITDNYASGGGGIYVSNSVLLLSGTTITDNRAVAGGGLYFSNNSNANFSNTNRCSVYENSAGSINDIFASEAGHVIHVVLDTFTINPPSNYYMYARYLFPDNACQFTYNILQEHRTEVNNDLYVSPTGNDDNDGLSPMSPMKTISHALKTIASDSLNTKSVFLMPGVYSSEDGQTFPINLKPFVRLVGDSINIPVIINQRYESTIQTGYGPGVEVKNLVLEHVNFQPNSVFFMSDTRYAKLENITINPVHAIVNAGFQLCNGKYNLDNINLNGLSSLCSAGIVFFTGSGSVSNSTLNDCHVTGSEDDLLFPIFYADPDSNQSFVLENISITNCSVFYEGIYILGIANALPSDHPVNPILKMSNVLVANNTTASGAVVSITMNSLNTSNILNCNFTHNENNGATKCVKLAGRLDVSNCIFANNGFGEINIRNSQPAGYTSTINFKNNLISGYPNSIYTHSSNQVTFNEFNFNDDPLFCGSDWTNPLSYRLTDNSPCIDTGTLDITGIDFPLFDLYGNPRMHGLIDIGCNEWNGTANHDESTPAIVNENLKIYPNPFKTTTTIKYNLEKAADVDLKIYNIKGQCIRTLTKAKQDKGEHKIYWDGCDSKGKNAGSGIYIARFSSPDNVISCRLVLIK